jgi:hypothetical protein
MMIINKNYIQVQLLNKQLFIIKMLKKKKYQFVIIEINNKIIIIIIKMILVIFNLDMEIKLEDIHIF